MARVLRLPRRLRARDAREHRPAGARRDGAHRGGALRRHDAQARDRVDHRGRGCGGDHRRQHRLLDRTLRRREAPTAVRPPDPAARRTDQDRNLAVPPPRRQGGVLGPLRLDPPHVGGVPRRHEPHGVAPLPLLQRRGRDRLGDGFRRRVLRVRRHAEQAEHDDRRHDRRRVGRDSDRRRRLDEAEGVRAAEGRRARDPALGRGGAR